MFANGSIRNK
ncbi:hypothetical protein CSPAE12_02145 [Colletotrichum incanum]|nr:hypothetical protein CSPAE12_02145 [Colletotrichum incanum]